MAASPTFDELLAGVAGSLCTRPLNRFAEESRLDGETLAQAVDRYEFDYAWQVLGSQRMQEQTVARLEARLGRAATEAQRACIAAVLTAAAAVQGSDLLMSFDNDVPEQLAALLAPAEAAA